MITLLSQIKADIFQAMRDKDTDKRNVLQIVRGNITNLAKEKRVTEESLVNSDIIDVIIKERKQQTDSLNAFTKGKRDDLAITAIKNIETLTNYLPKQLSEDEITTIIGEILDELGIENPTKKDRGLIMKNLMPRVKGKADGKLVSSILGAFMI